MDNGHSAQSPENHSGEVNSATGNSTKLISFELARDARRIGNKAIDSSDSISSSEHDDGKLGEIINLDLPPTPESKQPSDAEIIEQSISFDKRNIQTSDRLKKSGVKEVDHITQKLSQDGNAVDFYDAVRGENGMVAANLENSYHRKLAA